MYKIITRRSVPQLPHLILLRDLILQILPDIRRVVLPRFRFSIVRIVMLDVGVKLLVALDRLLPVRIEELPRVAGIEALLLTLLLDQHLLLVGVVLDVLPQTARICVLFCTADHLTRVRLLQQHSSEKKVRANHATYRVEVCSLMLGPVGAVGEALGAGGELAEVGPLTCVAPLVDLQVLQPRERLVAAFELQTAIISVVM
jgi:hypothetical protein